jgi:hypothetical protein
MDNFAPVASGRGFSFPHQLRELRDIDGDAARFVAGK